MKFALKISGKVQGYMYETVKYHILHKLQKDLEIGEDIATNLRKGKDTRIEMKEPVQEVTQKDPMTKEERENTIIREECTEEQ